MPIELRPGVCYIVATTGETCQIEKLEDKAIPSPLAHIRIVQSENLDRIGTKLIVLQSDLSPLI